MSAKSKYNVPNPLDEYDFETETAKLPVRTDPVAGSTKSDDLPPEATERREPTALTELRPPWVPSVHELKLKDQKSIRDHARKCLGWYQERLAERHADLVVQHIQIHLARYHYNRAMAKIDLEVDTKEKSKQKEEEEKIYAEKKRGREELIEVLEDDAEQHEREYKRMKIALEKHKEYRGLADRMYDKKSLDK
ncbi:hypothetical protein BGZ80_001798 [Entomortierella chlamydospora]|uniref:Uncharacterized protein n=1 Tax=Entomortierella chlamydospora TaxID=101097 RepID=A0A9P6MRC2_9FUNG|nr:hypothetical protein BGZ80_001798 [Entomortierella chlamydospora]